ncbi:MULTISPECIES: ferredoxin [unclassified Mesorhizobium]|jgi:ferredoxin|uniref:ferredoxin n=1 Tax=unclassified Mesorhizobium TaxID=325217 RepID=UPI00086DA628|nr:MULTISPECIES: ferredoxin [unclassified Mesorhizobium]MBN9253654.1 ferredoxin [Mesorhizobium sp.]ODT21027.1 MAG: ferredoxin [Mesorhizobium sp. SCN 65-12]OJX81941.1 MAG: ferredoxin [Mesorhizobium sp. 65-26]
MKIIVDRQRCDGNGVCMGIAPEVFDVDDDLYLHVAETIPEDPELRARVRQSITSCPILALKLVEE